VLAALGDSDVEGAYLVGHSMGGMVVPRVAARLPGARIIFLCAGFAHTSEDERLESYAATTGDFASWLIPDDRGRVTMSRENAITAFYEDLPEALADAAIAALRPQWAEGFMNVGPVAPYADRVAHVVCTADDRIIDPELHRRISETRFGITPITLPGSHSPFLSRPAELSRVFDRIVRDDRSSHPN
jgi:pimeloyl-ACP methyl ester carboxylesterase